ncbi:MAG: hypothetical protein IPO58_18975 [Betaproteobacteria bacterium]|nr:hypothetical protein [Betaproteobacteria bacterium]
MAVYPTNYQYDARGTLRQVILPDRKIDYVIDGENRRIGKKLNGVLTKGFLYQGPYRVVAELDGSNSVVSRFVYGNGGNVPDYMVKGGVPYRILSAQLGSPRLVVTTQGATPTIAQRIDNDEFGRLLQDSNPGFQPFGFAGGLYDPYRISPLRRLRLRSGCRALDGAGSHSFWQRPGQSVRLCRE